MSVGGNRSPYRPPCGSGADSDEVYFLGGPHQHYNEDDSAIEQLQNTTAGTTSQETQFAEPVAANTYAPYDPPQFLNLATCRKLGYKIVFAKKAWHGRYGFNVGDNCCFEDLTDDCCHRPIASSPPGTKYRTATWNITATIQTISEGTFTGVYTMSGSSTVGQLTGVQVTGDVVFQFVETAPSGTTTSTPDIEGDPFAAALWAEAGTFCVQDATADFPASPTCTDSGLVDETDFIAAEAFGEFGGARTVTVSESSYVRQWTGIQYPVCSEDEEDDFTIIGYQYVNYEISVTLSDPYTSDDVNADKDSLLGLWDLADDVQIPWRIDGDCTSGPLVSYFENSPAQPSFETGPFTDDSTVATVLASLGVGSLILGAPLTVGSDPYFDFRAVSYADDGSGCLDPDLYGAFAPSWAPNATQWTDQLAATAFYPCAWTAYNSIPIPSAFCGGGTLFPGYLVGSKYAEVILLTQPSHDFARPCGPKDAVTIDQTSIDCTTEPPTGTLRFPDATNPCPVPPDSGGEWNDNSPKGDWCAVSWQFNFRDIGEATRIQAGGTVPGEELSLCEFNADETIPRPVTGAWSGVSCSQGCSAFLPCCPAVVYISNNGESSPNSQTFTIASLACDNLYGALAQSAPMQWMTDPLWQVPQPPCDLPGGVAWTEDDGSGLSDSDTNWYYPQRPWEECRCSLPTGAPALTAGFLGCLDIDSINSAGSLEAAAAIGNVCSPPTFGQCWMPWWTWATNRANNTAGRFSCEYADPMAICEDDPEVEAP